MTPVAHNGFAGPAFHGKEGAWKGERKEQREGMMWDERDLNPENRND